jgi:protocatechuate 3,4-dioxygenase beta subunit
MAELIDRRRALLLFAGAGLAAAAGGCTSHGTGSSGGTGGSSSCPRSPSEDLGPFAADGSSGPDALGLPGIVRKDLRPSLKPGGGQAGGVPLRITLTVRQSAKGCAGYLGAAVYVWHCDRDGLYSMYPGAPGESYLRGIQIAEYDGTVSFTSVFPGAEAGRWPHLHVAVYPDERAATSGGHPVLATQLPLPEVICRLVYGTKLYGTSAKRLAKATMTKDPAFADGVAGQIPKVAGNVRTGFTAEASLTV